MIKNNFVKLEHIQSVSIFNTQINLWIICYYRKLYGLVNGEIGSQFSKDFLICLFLYLLN